MYRSDQGAAFARAHASWEDLVDAHAQRGTQPKASEPTESLSSDELAQLTETYERERMALPPVPRKAAPSTRPVAADSADTIADAQSRFGEALSEWFSLSRQVREREPELVAEAAAQKRSFDAKRLTGSKPKREGGRSTASYDAMTGQLRQTNEAMRAALTRIDAARALAMSTTRAAVVDEQPETFRRPIRLSPIWLAACGGGAFMGAVVVHPGVAVFAIVAGVFANALVAQYAEISLHLQLSGLVVTMPHPLGVSVQQALVPYDRITQARVSRSPIFAGGTRYAIYFDTPDFGVVGGYKDLTLADDERHLVAWIDRFSERLPERNRPTRVTW